MRFAVFDYIELGPQPIGRVYNERMEFVRALEDANFYGYYLSEHHFTPQSTTPSPSVFLAALARESHHIRLGALLFLLPLYHPLRLAEELCMLDHLSNGRLDVGVGRGVSPVEFEAMGEDYARSTDTYTEALQLLVKCFTVDRIDHSGSRWKFKGVPMVMKPQQRPYPPLWYGLRGDSGATVAARYGMNAVASGTDEGVTKHLARFRAAWQSEAAERKANRPDVTQPFVGALRNLIVADTDADADRIGRPAYQKWYDNLTWLWAKSGLTPPTGFSSDYDAARRTGSLVVGNPETVRHVLGTQSQHCGYDDLVMVMSFGTMSHTQAMHSLALFRDEVMPALQESNAPVPS